MGNQTLRVESSDYENQANHYCLKGKGRYLIIEMMDRVGKDLIRMAYYVGERQTHRTMNQRLNGKFQLCLWALGSHCCD